MEVDSQCRQAVLPKRYTSPIPPSPSLEAIL